MVKSETNLDEIQKDCEHMLKKVRPEVIIQLKSKLSTIKQIKREHKSRSLDELKLESQDEKLLFKLRIFLPGIVFSNEIKDYDKLNNNINFLNVTLYLNTKNLTTEKALLYYKTFWKACKEIDLSEHKTEFEKNESDNIYKEKKNKREYGLGLISEKALTRGEKDALYRKGKINWMA
ncbi:MAG: hypothetical protein WCK98_03750 [bacterium]